VKLNRTYLDRLTREVSQLIRRDPSAVRQHKPNYDTVDIVDIIRYTYGLPDHVNDTRQAVAPILKAFPTNIEGQVFAAWYITKKLLRYGVDPDGSQYVFNPSDSLQTVEKGGATDCKSFTLFVTSLLKNMSIPHGVKFVSYKPGENSPVSHVYAIAVINGKAVPVDTTIDQYGKEVTPFYNPLIFMDREENAGLFSVSGAPDETAKGGYQAPPRYNATMLQVDFSRPMTEAELQAKLFIQNRYILRDLISTKRGAAGKTIDGIASPVTSIDREIEEAFQIVADINSGDVAGIGRKAKKKKGKAKEVLQNIANKVKNGTKAVVELPGKAVKGFLKNLVEKFLPAAAPATSLYLFINDMNLIRRLPEKVRRKRKRQEQMMNMITRRTGLSQQSYLMICRNGILKRFGKQPEAVIADAMRSKIRGIGDVGVIPPAVIQAAIQLFAGIFKFFKDKKQAADEAAFSEADAPDLNADFAGFSDESLATAVKNQPDQLNEEPTEEGAAAPSSDSDNSGGSGKKPTGPKKTGWC
jgi:hypothetical protein